MKQRSGIPVIDARGLTPAEVVRQRPEEMASLMASTRRRYSKIGLMFGDAVSRQ